jgi:hypothetical protein
VSDSPLYFVWEDALPAVLCDALLAEWDEGSASTGQVEQRDGSFDLTPEIRLASLINFGTGHWGNAAPLYYGRLANDRAWQLDLAEVDMSILIRYESGGHYGWHRDSSRVIPGPGGPKPRNWALSVIMALTDPTTYEGGALRFMDRDGNPVFDERVQSRGSVTVFPSDRLHSVEPVESGVRFSIASWINGATEGRVG